MNRAGSVTDNTECTFGKERVQKMESTAITIMSFNVQQWHRLNSNFSLMKHIIDQYHPDVIALQEFTQTAGGTDTRTVLFADYPFYHVYKGDGEGVFNPIAVVSKIPFEDISGNVYQAQYTASGEKRGFIKARIRIRGIPVTVYNTHLEVMPTADASRTIRTAQAMELLNMMKQDENAICIGDFNTADCFDENGADYAMIIRPFLEEGYHSANCSDQHGFLKTWFDGNTPEVSEHCGCLDQIFTTSNIVIDNVTVDKEKDNPRNTEYIDHFPIVAYCHL